MQRYDLIVIGAGPAGLSAAIEAARNGMSVGIFDENERPGGQLFKQIHKFFGAKEHKAQTRGFNIGRELLENAEKSGVEVHLNSQVSGIHDLHAVSVIQEEEIKFFKGSNIIIATGAYENMIPFQGWTLPGIIGAGAAQTMVNLHRVLPGKKVLIVGSGNVGLVVGYQLKQAGMEVVAVIDAAPRIGGYGVHAAKLARIGVPFYLSHTITKAMGEDKVEGAVISRVDKEFKPIKGTETEIKADTVCIAVGLSPLSKLARMAGCKMKEQNGLIPECNEYGETSIKGIYVAGDVAGIEEASSAMITGKIAGAAASLKSGFIEEREFKQKYTEYTASLKQLRQGMFSRENKGRINSGVTDEGFELSRNLLYHGYLTEEETEGFPGAVHKKGIHPFIECTQNIPCNPCQTACRFHCIKVGSNITSLPVVDKERECKNCGLCVAACSGQAIFLINEEYDETSASITLPYEFLPLPQIGETGMALNRSGQVICEAEIIGCRIEPVFDHTALLTMKVPKEYAVQARFYKQQGGEILLKKQEENPPKKQEENPPKKQEENPPKKQEENPPKKTGGKSS